MVRWLKSTMETEFVPVTATYSRRTCVRDRNSGIGTKLDCSEVRAGARVRMSIMKFCSMVSSWTPSNSSRQAGMFSKSRKLQKSLNEKAKKAPDKPRIPSILSADLRISGDLKTDGDVQLDGIVDGDVESNLLSIGDSATVNGCVVGEIIRVAGTVNGEITGRVVELTRTARVNGDINHHSLAIEAGAFVQGLCRRIDPKQIEARPALKGLKPNLVVAGMDEASESDADSDNKGDAKAKSASA